jgi:hypothetical protein
VLSVEKVPFAEALSLVERGEICDGKSVCALLLARPFVEAVSGRR